MVEILTLVAAVGAVWAPFYIQKKDKIDRFVEFYSQSIPEHPVRRSSENFRGLLKAGICDLSHSDAQKALEEVEKRCQYNPLGIHKDEIWPYLGCFFKNISNKALPSNDDISGAIRQTIYECNNSCLNSNFLERLKKKFKGCKCPLF